MVVEQFLVFMEQRLALGGVGDEEGGLGLELDRGGKAPATGADDAQLVDAVERVVVDQAAALTRKCPFLASYLAFYLKIRQNSRLTLVNNVSYHSFSIKIIQK